MLLVGNNSINIKCTDTDNIPGGSTGTAAGYSVVLHLSDSAPGGGGA
jgi:hypothetical protein